MEIWYAARLITPTRPAVMIAACPAFRNESDIWDFSDASAYWTMA